MFESNIIPLKSELIDSTPEELKMNFVQSVQLTSDYWTISLTHGKSDSLINNAKTFVSNPIKSYRPTIFIHPGKLNETKNSETEAPSLTKIFGDWTIDKGDYHYKEDPKLFKVFNSTDWYDIKQELIRTGWYFVFATAVVILICYLVANNIPIK